MIYLTALFSLLTVGCILGALRLLPNPYPDLCLLGIVAFGALLVGCALSLARDRADRR